MKGPNIVNIAALIGDHARASMLNALLSGQALTATELSVEANISKQTASSHLSKLLDGGLIAVTSQGRHRYYRLASADVAHLLENMACVSQRTNKTRFRPGPRDPELRKARVCYDHLAGNLGVAIYDAFLYNQWIQLCRHNSDAGTVIELTNQGRAFLAENDISIEIKPGSRRPECRLCLDWSVRRYHLAGRIGAALLDHFYHKKWAKRLTGTRIVRFSAVGEQTMRKVIGLGSINS